jgi:Mn-containing catalase
MFMHNKRLMYTVRVGDPDPRMANLILEQFGGPDGELAAAMRYFTQGLSEEPLAEFPALSGSRTTYTYWHYDWISSGMNLSCCVVF